MVFVCYSGTLARRQVRRARTAGKVGLAGGYFMLSQVLRTITRHQLLGDKNGAGVLCAVSGGPDSMALLAALWELRQRLDLRLEVATVDHGLRPQAAAELAMVAARAAALDLPWHPIHVDVAAARHRAPGVARTAGGRGGVQEVARRLRLAALVDLAARRELARIALGHNADDQSETVLFRILRGTGVKGLTGIPYRRLPFIRPLLDVTRAQVLAYLTRRSLLYATDPSNADLRFTRARLRHQILPLLRRENPRVDDALRALAASAAGTIGGTADAAGGAAVSATLAHVRASGVHVPARLASEIASAVRDGRGTRTFDLAGGHRLTVAYGIVGLEAPPGPLPRERFPPEKPPSAPAVSASEPPDEARPSNITSISVGGPGTYAVAGGLYIVVREQNLVGVGQDGGRRWSWFDADRLSWPLGVRLRRPGDRMKPRGGVGTRKLSDLLIDAKVPRAKRRLLPVVVASDGELLFVPGLRPAQLAAPTSATVRRIGLAVVTKTDHDALVDPSIARGNTERNPHQGRTHPEPGYGKAGHEAGQQ